MTRGALGPLTSRPRLLVALGGALALVAAVFATCGGCCGHRSDGKDVAASRASLASDRIDGAAAEADVRATVHDARLWQAARAGEAEDLTTLAVQEGASGLVEAAVDPLLRPTALRAMTFARGYAQLPFLARTALGSDDAAAELALDAAVGVAARPRRAEDPEDAEELREGCELFVGLARDAARPRARRIPALRALRMLPCPRTDLPTDLDAK